MDRIGGRGGAAGGGQESLGRKGTDTGICTPRRDRNKVLRGGELWGAMILLPGRKPNSSRTGSSGLAAAEIATRYGVPGIAASDSHSAMEVAMSFNVLPAFRTAPELTAALRQIEWHGSRSSMLIHLTTRYAVWSKAFRRWMARRGVDTDR